MSKETFYITTPLYYPSDKFHIGHSYTTVVCDAIARYKRMQGYDVMFLTGTDEHGMKIESRAKDAGVDPKAFVDKIVKESQELWKNMEISYDRFVRTTDDYHIESIQNIFKQLYDRGEIYKGKYEGAYCKDCEAFWTDSQLDENGNCPDCGRPITMASEEAYFFKLSKYTDKILKLYEEDPDFLEPKSRMNEMINNFLKPGLDDLSVSRTSFKWGVPVSFDENHVVYVWIDALSGYITALGYGNDKYDDFDKYWPANVQFMAKEIVRFHSIIWPAILMALDLPLPKKVYAHGWLLFDGDKMSKSKGNVVDPVLLCQRYGVDSVKYFLLRDGPLVQDSNFNNELLINRVNSDLANDLGNLVSRTVAMVEKYFDGTLPDDRKAGDFDSELIDATISLKEKVETAMNSYKVSTALSEIFKVISRTNKYIDETTPWILAKDKTNDPRLASVMYNLLESIRICAVLLTPFIHHTSEKIFIQIGADEAITTWNSTEKFGELPINTTVNRGETLFPRIDLTKELEELKNLGVTENSAATVSKEGSKKEIGIITIDDFSKVELIVAEIKQCEPVPEADKLLKLMVDDGSKELRQIVSGIHTWYSPDDLIGKKVAIVANLKPVKLRGVLSSGMILAADVGKDVRVIMLDKDIPNGTKIR